MDFLQVIQGAEQISEELNSKLSSSIKTLRETFQLYDTKQLFLSFNGGKDCTVLLHLLSEFLRNSNTSSFVNLKIIYVQPKEPFPEIESFIEECKNLYSTNIQKINGSIRQVLEEICKEDDNLKGCIMGSRHTDPYCENLKTFQKTDKGWPDLMRINPILQWNCSNVWEYLIKFNVSYCSLYNIGYTSIGDITNTVPNPHLKFITEDGAESYLPAYKLDDPTDQWERQGRLK